MDGIKAFFFLVFLGLIVWFGILIFHTMPTIPVITDNITDNQTITTPVASTTDNITNNLTATALPTSSTTDNTTDNLTATASINTSFKIFQWILVGILGFALLLFIVISITERMSHAGGNTEARLHIPDETFILPQSEGNPRAKSHINNQIFTISHNNKELTVKIISVEKLPENTSRIRNRRLKNIQ